MQKEFMKAKRNLRGKKTARNMIVRKPNGSVSLAAVSG